MPKVEKKYSQVSVSLALNAVANGSTIRAASAQYGVPSSTLFGKLKHKYPEKATKGPSSILTTEEEQDLVDWIITISEIGFPINKDQILNSVQKLVIAMKRQTPFTHNRPGRHWYEAFSRRNPELVQRMSQNLTYGRSTASEKKLRNWFENVSNYLSRKNLLNVDPSRIYNCDESRFLLSPKADNLIVRKGLKRVNNAVNTDEKENLTTLLMVNGAGELAPPMVMFSYQRIPSVIRQNVPSGWSIGTCEKGWMTAETFFEYITNVFYPWLQQNNIEFPVILFIDGHSSHCTMQLSNFCREAKIELVALYPNASHLLQPLDVAVFRPLKAVWKRIVNSWRIESNELRLKKENFASLLKSALDSLNLREIIKDGFRACGLVPFSPDAVDFNLIRRERKDERLNEDNFVDASSKAPEQLKFVEQFNFMEEQLPIELIRVFEESERSGVWTGEKMYEGLYLYWQKIKRLAGLLCAK